jgi:hypothetical protein
MRVGGSDGLIKEPLHTVGEFAMETFTATLWTALVLYLMYKTNAVYSYLSWGLLSWLNPITKIANYKKTFLPLGMSYSDYMLTEHGNFLVKMLSCRYCFGFWLSLAASLAINEPESLALVYFGSQFVCSAFDWMERVLNNE